MIASRNNDPEIFAFDASFFVFPAGYISWCCFFFVIGGFCSAVIDIDGMD